jgi:pimeloyl-ACP methyl ester carboxylesterase
LLPAVIYFLFPEFLFNLAQKANRYSAGLAKKEIQVDSDRIVYLEGGKGETVLLVHGFGCDKDIWTNFSKLLTGQYHVVIPDLAGFGESTKRVEHNYGIDSQVKRLDRFTDVLHLQRFHLAGNSMGGTIAAVYGAKLPQKVATLALLAPAGLWTAKKSEWLLQLEKGKNLLLVSSPADFDQLNRLCFVKLPSIPGAFKNVLVAHAIADREFNAKIFKDLMDTGQSLEPFLPMIQAPTTIIWGDQDRILDVSGAPILEKGIKNHQTVIMKDTGHIPMIEKPEETAQAYKNFLKNYAIIN